jgi:ABC-type cobalamin/Fe3+-siderophores transport system ATPase subunit
LENDFGDPAREATWQTYVTKIEEVAKKNEVCAIGFTDYFMINGYKKVLEYKSKGRLTNIFCFPNIEFRLDKIVMKEHETRRLNFHVLFSPEVAPNDIEEHFLHDIEFIHEQDTFATAQKRKLKISNLEEFGKTLKEQHDAFRSQSDLYVGCMNAVVDPNALKEILEKDGRFRGKYLLCLAEDHALLDWDSQAHAIRKHLLQMAHCVFSSNKKTRDFCLGKQATIEKFIREFKSLKPCIWGCDGHGYRERFLVPSTNSEGKINFCWVKADLTWQGLTQILYEPEERLAIQQESPEPQKSIHTLDKIEIQETKVNERLTIKQGKIDFNASLISIIGGRGSGKTALLDMIASCFREGAKLSEIPLSFYKRLYGESGNPPIKIKLSTKFTPDAIEKKFGEDANIIQDSNIRYITQNHFEELSSPVCNLGSYIFQLLFEKYPDELAHYKNIEKSASEKQAEIDTMSLANRQLFEQITAMQALELEKQKKIGDRTDCEQRIKEIQEKSAVDAKLDELTTKLQEKRNERKTIESAQKRLEKIKSTIKQLKSFSTLVTEFNDEFSEKLGLKELKFLDDQGIAMIAETVAQNLKILSEQDKDVNKTIEGLNGELKSFKQTSKVITELKEKLITAKEEIEKIEKQIEERKGKEEELKDREKEMFVTCMDGIKESISQADFLTEHISTFEKDKSELLKNLDFSVQSRIDKDKYVNSVNELIDNRLMTEKELSENLNKLVIEPVNAILTKASSDFDGLWNDFVGTLKLLDSKIRKKSTSFDLQSALFKVPIETAVNLQLEKIPLESLSMGQRAIVLLQIILAFDDVPLLIDQPEESLDNEYIYEQLVSAFRSAKTKRQIIIATHNANLVVNTDSEQIIIAEIQKGEISYSAGTIENPETQERIKDILEGGKEAFEKREQRYGYKL